MATPYVGEIRLFAGNFAPVNWALCQGQLLAIAENDVLFSLIGTTYGGDGQTTFALPDLRGRVPVHQGQGPGLGNYAMGQRAGTETVTLNANQLAGHSHAMRASSAPAVGGAVPANGVLAATTVNSYDNSSAGVAMAAGAIGSTGSPQPLPHENMAPTLAVNYIIALYGVYPSQN